MTAYRITRVVPTYSTAPFELSKYVVGRERLVVGGEELSLDYLLCRVPLDCIDDITRSSEYNPRYPKEDHRDNLMDQMGTYGLIQPLVGTLDSPDPANPSALYLIDGRHRYNGLLELDERLKRDVRGEALRKLRARLTTSLSDPRKLGLPRKRSKIAVLQYEPERERVSADAQGAPLVPMKIYLDQTEVQRVGMAVFLNRGQKPLAGGEEIAKVAEALRLAIEEVRASTSEDNPPSEVDAVNKVVQSQARSDASLVVLSRHVAAVMNNSDSAWFPLIGRWQGETIKIDSTVRRKPLTASNFLGFASYLINDNAMQILDERQREREIWNLDRLGVLFSTAFDWPDDIPSEQRRYTSTAILCRSFLIRALGKELNEAFATVADSGERSRLLSELDISKETWDSITEALQRLHVELEDQAKKRERFEALKAQLEEIPVDDSSARGPVLIELDKQRGSLWSLDTVIPTLRGRLGPIVSSSGSGS